MSEEEEAVAKLATLIYDAARYAQDNGDGSPTDFRRVRDEGNAALDVLRSRDDRLGEELKRYGLEGMGGDPVDVLLRHIYANHEAALGAKDGTIAALQERAEAVTQERDAAATNCVWLNEQVTKAQERAERAEARKDVWHERFEAVAEEARVLQERAEKAEALVSSNRNLWDECYVLRQRAEKAEEAIGLLQEWLDDFDAYPASPDLEDRTRAVLITTQETDPE